MPVKQRVNIGVDTNTLEDPQWAPSVEGRSLVPRAGRVAEMDFPIRMTTEIDGTVYLSENGQTREMGGLELERLDENDIVLAKTKSSWDGFFIIPGITPGRYFRIRHVAARGGNRLCRRHPHCWQCPDRWRLFRHHNRNGELQLGRL